MATKFKFEIESDGLTTAQTLAFRTFIGTLGGSEFLEDIRQEETLTTREDKEIFVETLVNSPEANDKLKKAQTRKKSEKIELAPEGTYATFASIEAESEVEAEAVAKKIEVVEAETVSAPTLMQIRSLVAQKAAEHKDIIKSKLVELGAQNVSTLDAKHFQTIFDFLNEL